MEQSSSEIQSATDDKMLALAVKETALNQAIELYRDKAVTNFGEFNKSFMELVNKIHEFYGTKELS